MKAQLPINISSLCEFCEYLACCIVVARSPQGFHNVTLPKSWIIVTVDRFKNPKFKPEISMATLDMFVIVVSTLLESLYSGLDCKPSASCSSTDADRYAAARHLLFEKSDISRTDFIRSVFIVRV